MFIEVTDHLRCPEPHDERYLVLLPDEMDGRSVRRGQLGCPVCGRTYSVRDGIVEFGGAPGVPASASALDGTALAALLGLGGPGGYLALVGAPAARWRELLEAAPGVAPIAVNPPAGVVDEYPLSVVHAGRIPLKARSMRGVVLGAGFADDPHWLGEAVRVTLPGLRIIGEGPEPGEGAGVEVLATAGGCWVGTKSNRP